MKRPAFHPGKGNAFKTGPKALGPGAFKVLPAAPEPPATPAPVAGAGAPDVNPSGPNNVAGMMQGLMAKASPSAGMTS